MAVITETARPPTNPQTRIVLFLDPEAGSTVEDMLHAHVSIGVARSDGLDAAPRSHVAHIDDAIAGFDPGDAAAMRDLVAKLYIAIKDVLNL